MKLANVSRIALIYASHIEWHGCSRRRNVDIINWKRTYFVLVEFNRAGLGLALGLWLLSVLVLSGGVAPLARGDGGNRARLGPRGDRRRRRRRGRRYRDVGQRAQAGCGWAQGHRARRRRQWQEGCRRAICRLTRLLKRENEKSPGSFLNFHNEIRDIDCYQCNCWQLSNYALENYRRNQSLD